MNELALYEDVREMSPEELGGEIRMLTRQAKTMVLNYGIQIGYRLYVAKEKVENFVDWVERETEFSKSSAYRFIQLYTEYGSGQGSLLGVENSFPTLGKLSVSNALRLLAIPEEEREKFAEEVDAEHISARELDAAIAARKEAEDRANKLESELLIKEADLTGLRRDIEEAKEERDKLTEEIREIKARPVEVAVQEPDQAVIEEAAKKAADEAVREAKAKHDKQIEKLKKEAETAAKKYAELEKKKDALEKKLQEPGKEAELTAELESARREAEALRKKLAAADSGAGEAAIYCKTAQENFLAALDKVEEMRGKHPETAVKLLRGLYKIADAMGDKAMQMADEWGETVC